MVYKRSKFNKGARGAAKRAFRKRVFRKRSNLVDKPTKVMVRASGLSRGMPVPDRYITKMRFSARYQFSGSVVVQKNFRGCGAWDPDPASGGSSPYGFSSLAALYGKYICHGSKIKVRFLSTSSGANVATSGRCVLLPVSALNASTPNYVDCQAAAVLPYAKDTIVGPAGASSHAFLSTYMTWRRIFGQTGSNNNNTDAISTTGSTPNMDFTWVIVCESADQTTVLSSIIAYIEIEYYLEFFDRTEL